MYEDQMKALRWLANMFPYTHPAKSETDKMSNCIHLYCEQGANAIQELEITIAGLHEAIKGLADDMPRWIPVTERLPEEYDEVLLQFQHNQASGFWNGGCWCVHSGDDFYTEVAENEGKPTHWTHKLPEPKEK